MAKYDIKKTKKLKFARYGGLSSVNQIGYDPNDNDFHAPPASRGFYCFVWPFIELFLLGADCTKNPKTAGSKFSYIRDSKGNVIDSNHPDYEKLCHDNNAWSCTTSEYDKFCKDNQKLFDEDYVLYRKLNEETFGPGKVAAWVLVKKPKPRIFEYEGNIWHHLGEHLKNQSVIATKGNWVKTDIDTYRVALEKEMHHAHKNVMQWCYGEASSRYKIIPTKKSALRSQTKDHLECFIEKL